MCGIAGFILKDGSSVVEAELARMTSALRHRGPDGEGIWSSANVGLGHRRLSIIDPATGDQPMRNGDGSLWITYNGEIYNYRELRRELESLGHCFRTRSDTEVVVQAYEQWGSKSVERFRGMFAFAIADTRNRTLFLARDHFGIKPLLWLENRSVFAFASEFQSLRHISGADLSLDYRSIDQYLQLRYIPAPRTVYREIHKLPPGHRLTVSFDGRVGTLERYWDFEFSPEAGRDSDDWIEELDETIRESVRAHMVADVPFGAFLSGGVDSSAIVAYMASIMDQPVKTFTIGFEETEYSEIEYAEVAARRWGTEHRVEILTPDAMAVLPQLVRHFGEPFGDSSAVPTYYVAKLAAETVPMVLSGDGGDELFAGYYSYRTWMRWITSEGTPSWRRRLYPLAHTIRPHRYLSRECNLEQWMRIMGCLQTENRRRLWRPEHHGICGLPVSCFDAAFERSRNSTPLRTAQYLDLMTYMPFDILTKVDVTSMISSLEVRTPLVDVKIAEVAARLPESMVFGRDENGELEGKKVLKNLMLKYYPSSFVRRPKMGFGVPVERWFGPQGTLGSVVRERILGTDSPLTSMFRAKPIKTLVDRKAGGSLWLLVVLDEWLRQQSADAVVPR